MAKVGDEIKYTSLGPKAKKVITRRMQPVGQTARFTTKPNKVFRANIKIQVGHLSAARDDWAKLSPWKRYRWALCAWRQGIAPNPAIGYTGWSGMTLYFYMRQQQATPPGKQPISPCSSRATDPDASPWDYQP